MTIHDQKAGMLHINYHFVNDMYRLCIQNASDTQDIKHRESFQKHAFLIHSLCVVLCIFFLS